MNTIVFDATCLAIQELNDRYGIGTFVNIPAVSLNSKIAHIKNEDYRYEGNDVNIEVSQQDGQLSITAKVSGISPKVFSSVDEMMSGIDELFVEEWNTERLEQVIDKLEPLVGDKIVAFHISGGGGNRNKREYVGQKKISDFVGDLFVYANNHEQVISSIFDFDGVEWRDKVENAYYDYCNHQDPEDKAFVEEAIALEIGELVYLTDTRYGTCLSIKDAETGIGRVDIDGDYDTTYTCYLKDCDLNELKIIKASHEYQFLSSEAKEYVKLKAELLEWY
jgi:hypothetical protein